MPASAPSAGSAGVVRHLYRVMPPDAASSSTKSVKVPPMSKPRR